MTVHHQAKSWRGTALQQLVFDRRAAVRRTIQLSARARLVVRVASVAALAAGGVALGRGVTSMTTNHGLPVTTAAASAADQRVAPMVAEAAAPPVFTSHLRSWVTDPPSPPAAAAPAAAATDAPVAAVSAAPPAAEAGADPAPAATPTADSGVYTVVPGDTLSGIADQYGVQLSTLVQANHLANVDSLPAGTQLVVPLAGQSAAPAPVNSQAAPPVQLPAAPSVSSALSTDTPDATVRSFYARLNQGDFRGAAALWTAHMRSAFPPAQNIDSRFAHTTSLTVQRADVTAIDAASGRATVALTLTEVLGAPKLTRTYVGDWYLVSGPDGWMLDQPNLQVH